MPRSTTPSCAYSGMSLGRTSSRSTGAFAHGTTSERSVTSNESPASAQRRSAGSAMRPFAGTASVRRPFSPARVKAALTAPPPAAGAVERDPVPPGPVAEPLGDARHRGGRRRDPLGDLDVRQALLEQQGGLPTMGERLELRQRAEVAEEALCLVLRAQRDDCVREIVEAGDRLHGLTGCRVCDWSRHWAIMLAC